MNGEEIDHIHRITEDDWLQWSEPKRSWYLFQTTRYLMGQPQRCMEIFVSRKQLIVIGSILVAFLTGTGYMARGKLIMFLKWLL